jgi:hypothetical protein
MYFSNLQLKRKEMHFKSHRNKDATDEFDSQAKVKCLKNVTSESASHCV